MINKDVIKLASNTSNVGLENKYSHRISLKNSTCGDKITLELIANKKKISSMKYETISCVYCEASASLLAKKIKKFKLKDIKKDFITLKKVSTKKKGEIPKNWRKEVHSELDFRLIGSHQEMIEQRLGLLPDQCSLAIIRDDEYKYVHMTALPSLFFDLKRDPGEFENRIEDPDYQELVIKYSGKMLSWMINLLVDVHRCPAVPTAPKTAPGMVTFRSAL